jgi:hypothetical protein
MGVVETTRVKGEREKKMATERKDNESNEPAFQEIVDFIGESGSRSPAINRLLSAEILPIPDHTPPLPARKERLILELNGENSPDSDQILDHFKDLHFVLTRRHGWFWGGMRWYCYVVRSHPGRLDAPSLVRIPLASVYPLFVVYHAIGALCRTIKDRLNRGDKGQLTD